jgi:hypothetical protein
MIMKKVGLLLTLGLVSFGAANAQFGKLLKKDTASGKSSFGSLLKSVTGGSKDSLGSNNIASGLKEALSIGVQKGTQRLAAADGFFKDAAVKILLPPEAQKVEKTLRNVGMGKLVDSAILSMNRAAEDAAKSASPIFVNAIKEMSIQDAVGILKGTDTAATGYLRTKTTSPLTEAFRPVIETSLAKVNATKHWNSLVTAYNKIPLVSKVNPDLSAYVTEKALSGIFYQVGQEEKLIRKDPMARTTDLLKSVFGK